MLSRTKNSFFLILIVVFPVLILSACKEKTNNDEVIKAMEENLIKSNVSINWSTATILKSLEDKTTDWRTRERAKIWFSTAKKIVDLSQNLYNHIISIKERGTLSDSGVQALNTRLMEYKKDILTSDDAIRDEFNDDFDFLDPLLSLFVKDTLTSNKLSVKNISKANLSASLTLLQNYIKINENKITAFCHTKVGSSWDGFFSYSAIVGQSSTYVKPGEKVEITAGVGAFSKSASPVININGKNILLEAEGFAKYHTKAPKFPGTYIIPVEIAFIDPETGKKETQQMKVKYTVAKECN